VAAKKRVDGADSLPLLYLDECEVDRHPRPTKLWQRRGQVRRVSAAEEDGRFAVFGAVDYASGKVLWRLSARKELNVIERLWRHLKDELSCHRWWAKQAAREVATAHLLSHIQARFHQPDPGGIALVRNFCEVASDPSAKPPRPSAPYQMSSSK
jgi:hypothetical protein